MDHPIKPGIEPQTYPNPPRYVHLHIFTEKMSGEFPIKQGERQGSILAPFFFFTLPLIGSWQQQSGTLQLEYHSTTQSEPTFTMILYMTFTWRHMYFWRQHRRCADNPGESRSHRKPCRIGDQGIQNEVLLLWPHGYVDMWKRQNWMSRKVHLPCIIYSNWRSHQPRSERPLLQSHLKCATTQQFLEIRPPVEGKTQNL